jgi:hypothetical protein
LEGKYQQDGVYSGQGGKGQKNIPLIFLLVIYYYLSVVILMAINDQGNVEYVLVLAGDDG